MKFSNENQEFFLHELGEDSRSNFVNNLGELLAQTREGIKECVRVVPSDYEEYVDVIYNSGYEKRVNIHMDSYMAIIKDVLKAIES